MRAGDIEVFGELVDRHSAHVMRVVSRNLPVDRVAEVAHEAFVSAFVSLDRYRGSAPFEHWLTRITLRACSNEWRRRFREEERGEPLGDRTSDVASSSTRDTGGEREVLDRALARLSPEDREVLALIYFEELTIRESATILGWTETNTKVRAHRARRRLREYLAKTWPPKEDTDE